MCEKPCWLPPSGVYLRVFFTAPPRFCRRLQNLQCQPLLHRLSRHAPEPRQPAIACQAKCAVPVEPRRHLIIGAAHRRERTSTAGRTFFQRALKPPKPSSFERFRDETYRAVEDALGKRLLSHAPSRFDELATVRSWNLGSGAISRTLTWPLRGIKFTWASSTVLERPWRRS